VLLILATAAFLIQVTMIFYSNSMMTSCYPNEAIPWSHFPSKLPHLKTFLKIAIIILYQVSQGQYDSESGQYLDYKYTAIAVGNVVFIPCLCLCVYLRITKAIVYDRAVHDINIVTESVLVIFFLGALLADVLIIPLNELFLLCFFVVTVMAAIFVKQVKSRVRKRFLRKIDIFNYRREDEALLMLVYLHELIETSEFNAEDEFVLRGFVERHIELCDYPECNCLDFYKVINSSYRI